MVGCKRQQHLIHQQNMFKVIYHTLSVEKVHRGRQEVPVEGFCKAEIPVFAGDICNRDNLLKRDDLDGGDNGN